MAKGSGTVFAPVGDTLYNGYDMGGARNYPWSVGLAITPPAEYSNYIGSAGGLNVAPPVSALSSTTGQIGDTGIANAMSKPWSKFSPLPWIVAGLFGAVLAMHHIHYK